jgi:hypothetical protein
MLERIHQPDNLAHGNEPNQPDNIQGSDPADDGCGEAAGASEEWRRHKEREFIGAIGGSQGESENKSKCKRRPALRE